MPPTVPKATCSVWPLGSSLSFPSLPWPAGQAFCSLLSLCPCHCCLCLLCDTPRPVCVLHPCRHTSHRGMCHILRLTRSFSVSCLSLPPSFSSYPFQPLPHTSPSSPLSPRFCFCTWFSPRLCSLSPSDCPVPGPDLEINPTLESLCLSMTEHALGGEHFLFP